MLRRMARAVDGLLRVREEDVLRWVMSGRTQLHSKAIALAERYERAHPHLRQCTVYRCMLASELQLVAEECELVACSGVDMFSCDEAICEQPHAVNATHLIFAMRSTILSYSRE